MNCLVSLQSLLSLRMFNSLCRMLLLCSRRRFLAVLKRKMQFSPAKQQQLLVHIFWLVRSVQKGQVHFADEIVTRRNFSCSRFLMMSAEASGSAV